MSSLSTLVLLQRFYRILIISFLLSACGGSGGSGSSDSGNTPTVVLVEAGQEHTIILANNITLDATVTVNGQPTQNGVTYSWTQTSGPGVSNFSNSQIEDPTVSFTEVGSYVLNLQAISDDVTANDSLNITVNLKAAGNSGLASRPGNITECIAPAEPPVISGIQLQDPFPDLPTLNSPLAMYMSPGNSSYWYVIQQTGQVVRFLNSLSANSLSTFIDINDGRLTSGGERGLLGMAFHPDFDSNGFVYLSYTNNTSGLNSRISRFNLDNTGLALDSGSEQIILTVPQPYSNHNGGQPLL